MIFRLAFSSPPLQSLSPWFISVGNKLKISGAGMSLTIKSPAKAFPRPPVLGITFCTHLTLWCWSFTWIEVDFNLLTISIFTYNSYVFFLFFLLRAPGFGGGGRYKSRSPDDVDFCSEPLDSERLPCLPGGGCLAEWAVAFACPPLWPGVGVFSRCFKWLLPSAGLLRA